MKISIIIPTLNEENCIGNLLQSLEACKNEDVLEIIVVDAQSSDSTKEIAESHKVKFISTEHRNRAKQMNIGANAALGDVLYFIHADAIPPSTFVEDIKQAIDECYDLGGYRFRFQTKKKILNINSWFTRFNKLTFRGGDQTLFLKRDAFEKLGSYCEDHVIMEEYDLLIKAKKAGYRFKLMPKETQVSDRKYDHNSYLRVNIANLVAFTMFRFGADTARIKEVYFSILHHPKDEKNLT